MTYSTKDERGNMVLAPENQDPTTLQVKGTFMYVYIEVDENGNIAFPQRFLEALRKQLGLDKGETE